MVKRLLFFMLLLPVLVSAAPLFKLQLIFTGGDPLYPGQEFYVGYLYSFNTSIDLSEESLPLLDIKGFKKVGDRQVDEKQEGSISTRRVIQKLQAIKPGRFEVGTSRAVGLVYEKAPFGGKKYIKPALEATTSSLEIVVSPFPEVGKPASFNGAIGAFKLTSTLKGPSALQVGDRLLVNVVVEGTGEMQTVKAPALCCQPGFSGFFVKADLPPSEIVQEGRKSFDIELIVDNSDVNELPPIELASFHPKDKKYLTSRSAPIPIKVERPPLPPTPPVSFEEAAFQVPAWDTIGSSSFKWPSPKLSDFLFWGILWALFWNFAFYWRKKWLEQGSVVTSRSLYHLATQKQGDEALKLLEKALELKLEEGSESAEEVKSLLEEVESKRFGATGPASYEELMGKCKGVLNEAV